MDTNLSAKMVFQQEQILYKFVAWFATEKIIYFFPRYSIQCLSESKLTEN